MATASNNTATDALCKCLAFNLTMLVHAIHELGIEPVFNTQPSTVN